MPFSASDEEEVVVRVFCDDRGGELGSPGYKMKRVWLTGS
jgi:hypothetical protein